MSPQDVARLLKQLAIARHDINNALSLVSAASELIRMNPATTAKMLLTLNEQPPKIVACLRDFSLQLEQAVGLRKPV